MAKRKNSVLTEKQEAFKEAVLDGMTPAQAAEAAGYSHPSTAGQVLMAPDVKRALAEARNELSSAAQITRGDMLAVMMDAIDMARLLADPQSMIKGASEVSKMLGFYAPEVKKVELSMSQARVRSKLISMTDEELLLMASGQEPLTIDMEPPVEH